jgi:ABC-type sugar transport system ATPase subunit
VLSSANASGFIGRIGDRLAQLVAKINQIGNWLTIVIRWIGMATVALEGLRKSYGPMPVVHGIDLDVADGEFIVFVGPSGCGKSTILRMIAGLEDITDGEIRIGGERVNEIPAKDRNLAMVFQDYALYPHMSVAANIGFGLKMHGVAPARRESRVREIAKLLQLEPVLHRRPGALSGGQRQRVAMGRALARDARLFLFDEPLSNLDAKLRLEVRTQIKLLHRQLGMTSIFVTHDQTEAMTLADRIVCLDAGHIAQVGTPDELYNHPQNVFVATFIGSPPINLLPAIVAGSQVKLADGQCIALPKSSPALGSGRKVLAGFRPEDLSDATRMTAMGAPQELAMDFIVSETLGSDTYLIGEIAGIRVSARCAPLAANALGNHIPIFADADRLHLFDPETCKRI